MNSRDRLLVWLHGEIKTPPFGRAARLEARFLLRQLQQGEGLGMPQSRPMPDIGTHCHELKIRDRDRIWRIIYRIDDDAIVIADVYHKTTRETPKTVIDSCRNRLGRYDDEAI